MYVPFQRITYTEAMEKYGSDKPDLRYDLAAVDVSEIAGKSAFPVFVSNVAGGQARQGHARAENGRCVSGTALRKADRRTGKHGQVGRARRAWRGWRCPKTKRAKSRDPSANIFTVDQKLELFELLGAEPGDLLLFMSDTREIVYLVTDALRQHIAQELKLIDPNVLCFLWVIDFPEFYWNEEEQRWDPSQHMFTMPLPEDLPLLDTDPGKARGSQYDLVCNGQEVAGGSIRIHDRAIQEKIFPLIGHDDGAGARAVRAHAGSLRVRRAAARRAGVGHRPSGDGLRRRNEHPRGDRLPQDAAGRGHHGARAVRSQTEAA